MLPPPRGGRQIAEVVAHLLILHRNISAQEIPIRLSLPILALAAASFGIGTTEFVIMGLLPDVARSLSVTIPQAGYLVSGYALGVVIGAPIVAMATAGIPRKTALLVLMALFTIGNLGCALAPDYWLLMTARGHCLCPWRVLRNWRRRCQQSGAT